MKEKITFTEDEIKYCSAYENIKASNKSFEDWISEITVELANTMIPGELRDKFIEEVDCKKMKKFPSIDKINDFLNENREIIEENLEDEGISFEDWISY